jgi:hydroxymethylpyrimidine pyrophosphatase-like HAD family hydrolase
MLRTAGAGFAVANASKEAKKASASVTKSTHGKGVAEAVEIILASLV